MTKLENPSVLKGRALRPEHADTVVDAPTTLSQRVQSLRLPTPVGTDSGIHRLAWTLCVVLAGTTAWFAHLAYSRNGLARPVAPQAGQSTSPDQAGDSAALKQSSSSGAVAALPAVAPGSLVLESKGYIIPAHQILISPQVSGVITRLNFEEGLRVNKDDILAEVEKTDYDADFARAKATVELARQKLLELERGNRPEEISQAEAELAESEAQRVQLKAEAKRNADLMSRKIVTPRDYEDAESKHQAMDRRVERLRLALVLMKQGPRVERIAVSRAELQQSEAELAKSKWRLDNCTIRAPISGTVLKKNAEEGNIVNPVAFNGSYSLCEMADLADLEVDLTIQERDISRVFKGQRCEVRAEAFPERVYVGVVSRLMPIADRAKGAVPVRVKLTVPATEEGVFLKPEMGAVVSFFKESSQ